MNDPVNMDSILDPMTPLNSRRAVLNLITRHDFVDILDLFHEPETFEFISHLKNKTDEEYQNILEDRLRQVEGGTGYHWTARSAETGQLIGVLNLSRLSATEKVQLGFQLRKAYWNQGYGFELAEAVLKDALGRCGYTRIYGICEKTNIASARILRRLNFQPTAEQLFPNEDLLILVHLAGDEPA